MKVIEVTIRGKGMGVMLHNPAGMGSGNATGKKVIPTPAEEAKTACYWTEDGKSLAMPGWNVFRAMVKAAAGYKDKVNKTKASTIVSGSVVVQPDMIPFGTKHYAIDTRRAVVQRQGILRSRPLLKHWQLSFELLVSEEDMSAGFFPVLRAIMEDTGRKIGIGDFRVEKNGPFGKFDVVAWKVR